MGTLSLRAPLDPSLRAKRLGRHSPKGDGGSNPGAKKKVWIASALARLAMTTKFTARFSGCYLFFFFARGVFLASTPTNHPAQRVPRLTEASSRAIGSRCWQAAASFAGGAAGFGGVIFFGTTTALRAGAVARACTATAA